MLKKLFNICIIMPVALVIFLLMIIWWFPYLITLYSKFKQRIYETFKERVKPNFLAFWAAGAVQLTQMHVIRLKTFTLRGITEIDIVTVWIYVHEMMQMGEIQTLLDNIKINEKNTTRKN